MASAAGGQRDEDGFLGVEAVFGLLEDGRGVEFQDFFTDFLAAVGGEAVENDVVRRGGSEESGVDFEAVEFAFFFLLVFLAHGEPDVGVDDGCAVHRDTGIVGDGDVGGVQGGDEIGGRLAGRR